jgi:hypothetical protein
MTDQIEAAVLESLGGFPWRRSLAVITDACQAAAQCFRDEVAATPPD